MATQPVKLSAFWIERPGVEPGPDHPLLSDTRGGLTGFDDLSVGLIEEAELRQCNLGPFLLVAASRHSSYFPGSVIDVMSTMVQGVGVMD